MGDRTEAAAGPPPLEPTSSTGILGLSGPRPAAPRPSPLAAPEGPVGGSVTTVTAMSEPAPPPQHRGVLSESGAEEQTYAWNWFALHAGQRMQLVNFWLIAVAFLVAAYVQATTEKLVPVAVGVCAAGAAASIAFALLDERTRHLVQVAEAALRDLEDERAAAGGRPTFRLVLGAQAARKGRASSYRVIIQTLQLTVAALFLAAAVYTLS